MTNRDENDPLRDEVDRLWGGLLPEQRARLVELARLHSLTPTTRRLLHELADLEAEQGRAGLVRRLVELRDGVQGGHLRRAPAGSEAPTGSEVTDRTVGLLDQESGFEDLARLAAAHARLGPVARRHAVRFFEALAAGDPAAASAAGGAACEQVEDEARWRWVRGRRTVGDSSQ